MTIIFQNVFHLILFLDCNLKFKIIDRTSFKYLGDVFHNLIFLKWAIDTSDNKFFILSKENKSGSINYFNLP